jgi:hypothetical protein
MTNTFETITRILNDIHRARPDLRLGQIIGNALPPNLNGGSYYASDADLLRYLREYQYSQHIYKGEV